MRLKFFTPQTHVFISIIVGGLQNSAKPAKLKIVKKGNFKENYIDTNAKIIHKLNSIYRCVFCAYGDMLND